MGGWRREGDIIYHGGAPCTTVCHTPFRMSLNTIHVPHINTLTSRHTHIITPSNSQTNKQTPRHKHKLGCACVCVTGLFDVVVTEGRRPTVQMTRRLRTTMPLTVYQKGGGPSMIQPKAYFGPHSFTLAQGENVVTVFLTLLNMIFVTNWYTVIVIRQ